MAELVKNPTSKVKVNVYQNRDGNILQPGEMIASQKTVTFSGIKSESTVDELINTENSPAIHNGVSGLMWLFTGSDEGNFDTMVEKITSEVVEE